jgi:hypothetical protein
MTDFFQKTEVQVTFLGAFLTALIAVAGFFINRHFFDRVTLEIEFISPDQFDLRLFRWVLPVNVKNHHATKTARNVKVWLKKIEWPTQPGHAMPLNLKQLAFPLQLPEAGQYDVKTGPAQVVDMAPKPFEITFDCFFVGGDYPGERTVGIASFAPPWTGDPDHMQRIVIEKVEAGAQFDEPVEQYFHTRSEVASFKAMESGGMDGKFTVTLQVTADDIKTVEKTAVLVVPASTLPNKFQYAAPYWIID